MINEIFSGMAISGSGMLAEKTRMQMIAQNIANLHTTRQDGVAEPYRRREVVFAEVLQHEQGHGVAVDEVIADPSEPVKVYQPNHPDADTDGYVRLPNIELHFEMVDLLSAARAYEANLVAMRVFKEMTQRTLQLE